MASTHEKVVKNGARVTTSEHVYIPIDDSHSRGTVVTSLQPSSIEKWWLFETAAWTFALATILGLFAFLKSYDGKAAPQSFVARYTLSIVGHDFNLRPAVTVNSIISIFNTAFKLALFVPVSAALSQLKWTWFSESHALSDYQTIDKSKNSVWGSLVLLWNFRARRLACLGAFITVAALSIDFGFQSLVSYRLQDVLIEIQPRPSVPNTLNYAYYGFGPTAVDPSMLAAIYAGLYSPNYLNVTPICATGNCKWETYGSVGICSQCDDLTKQVIKSCGTYSSGIGDPTPYCNYTLPSGHQLNLGGPWLEPAANEAVRIGGSGLSLNMSNAYSGAIQAPLTTFSILQVDSTSKTMKQAAQCALFFCAKTFNTTVAKGTFTEFITGTWTNSTANETAIRELDSDVWIRPPVSFLNKEGRPVDFVVNRVSASDLNEKLASLWKGNCSTVSGGIENVQCFSDVQNHFHSLNFSTLSARMINMATTMTNAMRVYSDESGDTNTQVEGKAYETQNTVYVVWGWFALFAVFLVLCLVFFVATAVNSANSNVTLWKSNSLAAFVYALTDDARNQLHEADMITRVDEIASDMKVKLEDTHEGRKLVEIGIGNP